MKTTILWNGGWERRSDHVICRWMVAWFNRNKNLYGAVAGYSGGGCFQLERFSIKDGKVSIEAYEDIIFENEVDKSECELCLDKILSKHSSETWESSETLYLNDLQLQQENQNQEMIIAGDKMPEILLKIFESVGLITKPGADCWI